MLFSENYRDTVHKMGQCFVKIKLIGEEDYKVALIVDVIPDTAERVLSFGVRCLDNNGNVVPLEITRDNYDSAYWFFPPTGYTNLERECIYGCRGHGKSYTRGLNKRTWCFQPPPAHHEVLQKTREIIKLSGVKAVFDILAKENYSTFCGMFQKIIDKEMVSAAISHHMCLAYHQYSDVYLLWYKNRYNIGYLEDNQIVMCEQASPLAQQIHECSPEVPVIIRN